MTLELTIMVELNKFKGNILINKTSKRFITLDEFDLDSNEKEMVYYLLTWKYALVTDKRLTTDNFIVGDTTKVVYRQDKQLFEINDFVDDAELDSLHKFVLLKLKNDLVNIRQLTRSTYPFHTLTTGEPINIVKLSTNYKKILSPKKLIKISTFYTEKGFVDKLITFIKGL